MRRLLIAALTAATVFAVPAAANAAGGGYYTTKAQAERNTRDAAELLYGENYGVSYGHTGAYCRPQGAKKAERGYAYHRWVCAWAGEDSDGDTAYGQLRITGHSGNRYGYMVLHGISWD